MASLVSWLKKGANTAYHGINPFDGGQGWTDRPVARRPVPPLRRPAPPQRGAPVNIGDLQVRPQAPPPRPSMPDPVADALRTAILNPIARAAPNIAVSIGDALKPGKQTFQPKPGLQQTVFGKEPVISYQRRQAGLQKAINGTKPAPGATLPDKVQAGLREKLSVPLSIAGTGANAALDASLTAPLVKTAGRGAVAGLRAVDKAAVQAAVRNPAGQIGGVGKNVKAAAPKKITVQPSDIVEPKKITAIDRVFRPIVHNLNKIDPRLGEAVVRRSEIAETGAAAAKSRIKIARTLDKNEQVNLARVLEGKEKPANPKIEAAAKEVRLVLNTVYYHSKNTGVPVTGFRKNYFPRIYDHRIFNEKTPQHEATVQKIISSGQAKTRGEAVGILRKYKEKRSVTPYGNLTKTRRADIPGYAENLAAIDQYIDRAYGTIAHTKVAGKNEAKLNKIFADIQKNGGDYDTAVKYYRRASGLDRKFDSPTEKAANAATTFQGTTKLGVSSLGNIQQQLNNVIAGGGGRTGKHIVKYPFRKASQQRAKASGVTDEQVAHEALFGEQGLSNKTFKIPGTKREISTRDITAPLFEKTEKGNRGIGGNVGLDEASALAKRAGPGDLLTKTLKLISPRLSERTARRTAAALERRYGITRWKKDGGLYKADETVAQRRFVERTQFRTRPQDLPYWASSPGGRVVSQFKRYPYKQTGFYKREVIDEARRGNLMPLARLLAVSPAGLAANQATDAVRNFAGEKVGVPEQVLNVVSDVTGANLIAGMAQQLYPNSYDSNAYITKVAKTLGGPTIGDAAKLIGAAFDAKNKSYTNAGRFALSHLPPLGPVVSPRVFPYKGSSSAAQGNSASAPGLDPNSDQAKADSKKQTENFKKSVGDGYGLNKLPNGKYIYSIKGQTHTTADISKARKALASAAFKDSGDAIRTITYAGGGNIVLRRSPTGGVSTTTKDQFEYQLNSATLTHLKNIGDTGGWISTANDLIANIDRQMADSKYTDPLDAAKLQNKKDSLLKQLKKYGVGPGVGGSSSGGGGGRRSGGGSRGGGGRAGSSRVPFITTGLKTASASKPPKPPAGVKVKAPSAKAQLKTKKLIAGKKPKIG